MCTMFDNILPHTATGKVVGDHLQHLGAAAWEPTQLSQTKWGPFPTFLVIGDAGEKAADPEEEKRILERLAFWDEAFRRVRFD